MTLTKLRKGSVVYAKRDLGTRDIFPGSPSAITVFIKKGTKGKVTDTSDEELPLVKFDNGHEWHIDVDDLVRRKPQ